MTSAASAEPKHGIAMHGEPALPADYQHFQYADPDAPKGGSVTYGAHNSQHITANRKAYAMWYILARIAGWDGTI